MVNSIIDRKLLQVQMLPSWKYGRNNNAILKGINVNEFVIFCKKNSSENIDKRSLTNLNIPMKAFAIAQQDVKSTNIEKMSQRLIKYSINKDEVLTEIEEERKKAGR